MRGVLGVAWGCLLTSCTLGNAIDVCSRKGPAERDLNARTEGDQAFSSRNQLAAMPGGGGMAVWTSALPEAGTSEVRGGLVTADGTLLKTCEADAEFTYSLSGHVADQPVLAAPRTTDQLGALAYRRHDTTGEALWVVPITPSGCPVTPGLEPAAFELRPSQAGVQLINPSIATLGDQSLVVTWTEVATASVKPRLFARRFRLTRVGEAPQFLPTPNGPNGEAADAVVPDAPLANGTLTPTPDGAALAYFEVESDGYRVWLARFGPDLAPKFNPVLLADAAVPSGLVPAGVSINLAYEPDSFLVGWQAGDEQLAPVVEAMFVSGSGQYLSAPRAPNGGPFRLGAVKGAVESAVALVGSGDGGFLAAWQESGTLAHADQSGQGLRALGFTSAGAVRFANRACDALDFPLNRAQDGDQTQPALARLGDGTILAAWVNNGGQTADRSGTGLRVVGLTMRDLFPLR